MKRQTVVLPLIHTTASITLLFMFTYQVAEAPEETVSDHKLPSLFNILRYRCINVVSR